MHRPLRSPSHPFTCWFLLTMSVLCGRLAAFGQEAASVDSPAATDRQTLLEQHDTLAQRLQLLWQQGRDREVYETLQELLALYRQIYPAAEHPRGHSQLVSCYRDLCRLSELLGEHDALLRYAQDGMAVCRMLYSPEDYPHGHLELARMSANLGHAHLWAGQLAEARATLVAAVEMSRQLEERGEDALHPTSIANLLLSVAAACSRQGDDWQALHYVTEAVECCRHPLPDTSHLQSRQLLAKCLLRHGQALVNVGDYPRATTTLQQALDHSFYVHFAQPSHNSHLALIDAHIELGVLHRIRSDLPTAKRHLLKAQQEVGKLQDAEGRDVEVASQLLWLAQLNGLDDKGRPAAPKTILASDSHACSLTSAFRDETEEVNRLLDVGAARQSQREHGSAEEMFRSAHAIASRLEGTALLGCHPSQIWPDLYLGGLLQDIGDYQEAYSHFFAAMVMAQRIYCIERYPLGHPILANVIYNAGTLHWLVGETEHAASLYHEAMVMQERLYPAIDYPRGHRLLMASYVAWAGVLRAEGDLDGAACYLDKAHAIASAQYPEADYPDGHNELAMVWRSLGQLRRAQGDYASAVPWFQRMLDSYQSRYATAFPDGHVLICTALSELGRTWAAAGDGERARGYLEQSLAMCRGLFTLQDYPWGHPLLASGLRDLGQLYRMSDLSELAYEALAESSRMEQAVAESFFGGGSEALLLNLAARKFQSLDCLLDASLEMKRPAADVYGHVWRRRGFVPRLIAERHRLLRQLAQVQGRDELDEYLRVRRDASRALLISAVRSTDDESQDLDRVRQINLRKEALEDRLARSLSAVDQQPITPAASSPDSLVWSLPSGTVLLDYVQYRPDYGCFAPGLAPDSDPPQLLVFVVAAGRDVRCVHLGDARVIDELARQWRTDLLSERRSEAGSRLRQLVWDPVSTLLPPATSTIYIAPDGDLASIPFSALPLPDGRQLLIEQYATAIVPSGVFLLEQLIAPMAATSDADKVLAVGQLDYGVPAPPDHSGSSGVKQLSWSPLSGSGDELESIVASAGTRLCVLMTGRDADVDSVVRQLGDCRWAHFATHGFFVDDRLGELLQLSARRPQTGLLQHHRSRNSMLERSPFLRSGLALSGANELGELDESGAAVQLHGLLTADRIAATDCTNLELVVLSACETGRGDVVHGDGVFGMHMAFHVAGARNVVASLWRIDDQSTAQLIHEFYRLLWEQSCTPLEALRGAQLVMLHKARQIESVERGPDLRHSVPLQSQQPKATHDPGAGVRHWAGFVLSGPGF